MLIKRTKGWEMPDREATPEGEDAPDATSIAL